MSEGSAITKVVQRVFPRVPDFFTLMNDQCAIAVDACQALVEFMKNPTHDNAERVASLEHEADKIKARNMDKLNQAFTTPIDREDLYRAFSTLDHVINYAKSTVLEMEALGIKPDLHTAAISEQLLNGAKALQEGYALLSSDPGKAEANAAAARKAERNSEKEFRAALGDLFTVDAALPGLDASANSGSATLLHVVGMMKKREIYRHLSNAADRIARAGEVLHDIVVKLV